jgi:hypothetical protein
MVNKSMLQKVTIISEWKQPKLILSLCSEMFSLVLFLLQISSHIITSTLWPESTSELYRPSVRHLWVKLMPTFADRCYMVSVTDPYNHNLAFLDWSHYFFFQVASQLYSWGRVDPVPDPLLLRKSGIEPRPLDL